MASVWNDVAARELIEGMVGSGHTSDFPSTWQVGLSTTTATRDAGTGVITGITEPSDGAYARVNVANTNAEFDDIARGKASVNTILFPTAAGPYTITAAFVHDGTRVVAAYNLPSPVPVATGETARIAAGQLLARVPVSA